MTVKSQKRTNSVYAVGQDGNQDTNVKNECVCVCVYKFVSPNMVRNCLFSYAETVAPISFETSLPC